MTQAPATQSSNSNSPATKKDWLQSDGLKEQLAQAMPKHLTPDRFMRILFTSMQKTPLLMKCSQASLFTAMIDCSMLGIEPDGRRAHLLPYKNNKTGSYDCQLIIDYKGLVELVMRSGLVSNVHADIVCENDEFEYNMGHVSKHTIDFRKPRGEMYAAYCIATFKDGSSQSAVMTKEEIDAIRSRSKAGKFGPWVTDYNEMAKKTVFRRLSKWLPISPEQRDLIEKDDNQFDFNKMSSAGSESTGSGAFEGFAAGGSDEDTTATEQNEEEAEVLIDDDRLQFILERLKDEDKTEAWFCKLSGSKVKSVAKLTQDESSAAMAAWEGGAE